MDAGSGQEQNYHLVTVLCVSAATRTDMSIERCTESIMVTQEKAMFAIVATIRHAVTLNTFSLERTKKMSQMQLRKTGCTLERSMA
jgi:hypothetical protein